MTELHFKRGQGIQRGHEAGSFRPGYNGAAPKSCEWPHGEVGQPGFHFCGAARVRRHSYCVEHLLQSTRPEYRPALKRALKKAGYAV